MTDIEIRIDRMKAERIVAQVLRSHGLKPEDANSAATAVCNRLVCSMPIYGGSPACDPSYGDGGLRRVFR